MRLDHIAYRVTSRSKAVKFFKDSLGYKIDPDLEEGFDIQFEDGTLAKCYALIPPEQIQNDARKVFAPWPHNSIYHNPPEIFVSEGTDSSIVSDWVLKNGPGIHHLAYEVSSVKNKMEQWKSIGIDFLSDQPLQCPGLIQVFTKPHPITGMIYELIQRTDKGFCKDNVKDLMKSTKK